MSTFENDYKFGIEKENEIFDQIRSYFKRNIKKANKRYSKYDFYDSSYKYELKSRTNNYRDFDTTIIAVDKIQPNTKTILLINFVDGLYYIEYNKTLFDIFEQKYFQRKSRPDKYDVNKLYFYIPISELKPIQTTELDF